MQGSATTVTNLGLPNACFAIALLAQAGLAAAAVANVKGVDGAIVIKAQTAVRSGWAEAAAMLAQSQKDCLVLGAFSNTADADPGWINEAASA